MLTAPRLPRYRCAPGSATTSPLPGLRIIELLLVTTVPTMIVAERGPAVPVADRRHGDRRDDGGRRANAINMYVDRDIDRVMERTKYRIAGRMADPQPA